MKAISQFLLKHKWVIVLSVLTGIIMSFPQAYFRYEYRDIYQGIDLNFTDAELFYWGRIQEVRDGRPMLGNVNLFEGKDLPYVHSPLSENITALLGGILFLDIKNTILISRFFFPIFVFLLIYFLIFLLTKKKIIGLVGSSMVLLTGNLLSFGVLRDLLLNQTIPHSALVYARPVAPQVHLLFFYGFLLLFFLFLQKKKLIYGVTSSIIAGLSFYTYPYNWTFIYVFMGLLLLIFALRGKWSDVKNIFWIIFGGLIISIPYWINVLNTLKHSFYNEVVARVGLVGTHYPQLGIVVVALLVIFLLFFSKKRKKRYYFCLSLVLTPIVLLNQQIITGKVIASDHYHWYYNKPLLIIFLVIIIFEWLDKKNIHSFIHSKFYVCLVGAVLIFSFSNGFLTQLSSYNFYKEDTIRQQRYGSVINWLNQFAQKDEVVFSSFEISNLITSYTSLNVVTSDFATHGFISNKALLERLFLTYRMEGLNDNEVLDRMFKDRAAVSQYIYGQYYLKKLGDYSKIPDNQLIAFSDQYGKFSSLPISYVFDKYNIKYIIWDKANYQNWRLDNYHFLEQVYKGNGIAVYKIK